MSYIYTVLGAFAASTVGGFVISYLLALKWEKEAGKEVVVILISLAIIGACAGTAGGMSRVGAAASIIPAFLGLLGGLSIYLFGIDKSKGMIASIGSVSIGLSLIISYTLGAFYRNIGDDHREIRSICAQAYTNAEILKNEEVFSKFRQRFGRLCDSSMSWRVAN